MTARVFLRHTEPTCPVGLHPNEIGRFHVSKPDFSLLFLCLEVLCTAHEL